MEISQNKSITHKQFSVNLRTINSSFCQKNIKKCIFTLSIKNKILLQKLNNIHILLLTLLIFFYI